MSHLFQQPYPREPPGNNLTSAPDPAISSRPDPPKKAPLRRFVSASSLVHGPESVESSISAESNDGNNTNGNNPWQKQRERDGGSHHSPLPPNVLMEETKQKEAPPGSSVNASGNAYTNTNNSKPSYPVPGPTKTAAATKGAGSNISLQSSISSKSNHKNQRTSLSSFQKGRRPATQQRVPFQKSPTSVIDVIQEGSDEDSVPFDEKPPWWQRKVTSHTTNIPGWQQEVSSTASMGAANSIPKVIIQPNNDNNNFNTIQQMEEALQDIFEDEYDVERQQPYKSNNDTSFRSADYESIASSVVKQWPTNSDPPADISVRLPHGHQKIVRKGDKVLRRKVMDPEPTYDAKSNMPWKKQSSGAAGGGYYSTKPKATEAAANAYQLVAAAAAARRAANPFDIPTPTPTSTPKAKAPIKNSDRSDQDSKNQNARNKIHRHKVKRPVKPSSASTTTNKSAWVPPPSLQHQIHYAQIYQNRLDDVLKDPTVKDRIVIPTAEELYEEMVREQEILTQMQQQEREQPQPLYAGEHDNLQSKPFHSPVSKQQSSPDLRSKPFHSPVSEQRQQQPPPYMTPSKRQVSFSDDQASSSSSSDDDEPWYVPSSSSSDSGTSESFHDEEDDDSEKGKPVGDEIVAKIDNPGYQTCWEALWGNLCSIGLFCFCLLVWIMVVLLALSGWGEGFTNDSSSSSDDTNTAIPDATPRPTSAPTPTPAITPSPSTEQLFEKLPALSQQAISANPESPQGRAWEWLQQDDEIDYSDERLVQRFSLATLYYATDGDQWDFIGGHQWLSHDMNECMWYRAGIVCQKNSTDLVEVLYLPKHNLRGSIPPEIGVFTNLVELSLGTNPSLQGTIPSEIGSLTGLQGLDLHQNDLTGPLPSEIGSLTDLTWLTVASQRPESGPLSINRQAGDASGKLNSTIPTQIGQLTKLKNLRMESNRFQGRLPSEMENLTELQTLVLSENELTGPLPTSLSRMSKLQVLELNSNDGLNGTVPIRWGAEWGELQRLWLHDTSLNGSVPATLCFLNTDSDYVLDSLRADCSELLCECDCWCD